VRRWFGRCAAEGLGGLSDAPRSGAPPKAAAGCRERLLGVARCRPRAPGLPFSLRTAARLADRLAELTGVRVGAASVRRLLREGGTRLSRPQHAITSLDPQVLEREPDLAIAEFVGTRRFKRLEDRTYFAESLRMAGVPDGVPSRGAGRDGLPGRDESATVPAASAEGGAR
jgi:transposase